MRDQYFRFSDGIILMYAINNRRSFEELDHYYEQIQRIKDSTKFSAILVGNKYDLVEEREVETGEGIALASAWNIPFFESSGKLYFKRTLKTSQFKI